jgi:hypothetical protein
MPFPARFAHGAARLQKDVRLLGDILGERSSAFAQLRTAAVSFIELALVETSV